MIDPEERKAVAEAIRLVLSQTGTTVDRDALLKAAEAALYASAQYKAGDRRLPQGWDMSGQSPLDRLRPLTWG